MRESDLRSAAPVVCRRLATAAAEITRPSPQDAESVGARSLGTGEERRRQELGVQAPPLDLLPRLLDHLHTVPGTGSDSYSPPQPIWLDIAIAAPGGTQQRGGGWRGTGGSALEAGVARSNVVAGAAHWRRGRGRAGGGSFFIFFLN